MPFVRFGNWRDDEKSYNAACGEWEDGVSVYDVRYTQGQRWEVLAPDPSDVENPLGAEDTFWGLMRQAEEGKKRIFLVDGEVAGIGYDGEPLIENVEVVDILRPSQLWSDDFGME